MTKSDILKKINRILFILIIINIIIFFIIKYQKGDFVSLIISAIMIIIYVILIAMINKKSYANKIWERVGIGIISGGTVSLFRDTAENTLTKMKIITYFMLFIISIILTIMGLLGQEKNN